MTSSHELQPGASQNPGAFSLDFLTWAFVHVGLEGLLTFQLVATAGLWFFFLLPWHPLSLHSPHTHTNTGHRSAPTQDVRVSRNKAPNSRSTAASLLLQRYIVMIYSKQLSSPYMGEVMAQRRERDPSRPHPTPKAYNLSPLPRAASSWSRASPHPSPSQDCFQSPMSPDTSDPFDKLKPGGPRRRALLPGHMTSEGSPLNCCPPLPETLVVGNSSDSDVNVHREKCGCEGV